MSVLSFVNSINRKEIDILNNDTKKLKRDVCKLTYGSHNFDDNGVCKNCGYGTKVNITAGTNVNNLIKSISNVDDKYITSNVSIVDNTYSIDESLYTNKVDLSDTSVEQDEHIYAYTTEDKDNIIIKPTADIVICNKEMSLTFGNCTSLTDISALANWDVSNVTCMNAMFYNCTSLSDISPLSNWDVSMVLDTYGMFMGCTLLADITPTY